MTDAVLGGALIGAAAAWLYLSLGRIAGISGIAAQAVRSVKPGNRSAAPRGARYWPLLFIAGLGIGGWLANAWQGTEVTASVAPEQVMWLISGGLLVGFGTRLGSGCTSGHGVCGVSRLSPRSMVATITFLGVGMLVATSMAYL